MTVQLYAEVWTGSGSSLTQSTDASGPQQPHSSGTGWESHGSQGMSSSRERRKILPGELQGTAQIREGLCRSQAKAGVQNHSV